MQNDDELDIKCTVDDRTFPIYLEEEKRKGVRLVDCPFCNKAHKINFDNNDEVDIYRGGED